MTNQELIAAATARLRQLGMDIPDKASLTVLCEAIGTLGNRKPWHIKREDFVRAWMEPQRTVPVTRKFRPMKARHHPRLAEIERAQPPMLTPCGTGNGTQFSAEWGR